MTAQRNLDPSSCFACSPDNHRGLHLTFRENEGGEMIAEWVPEIDFEGLRGIIHGGVVSTLLDEAMAKVVAASGFDALTAELRVRFRQEVPTGKPVRVRGWIEGRGRRMIRTEATLTQPDGVELAHAWAVFLALKHTRIPASLPPASSSMGDTQS
jgi:acyl-coenzyme A thioesterase PaaI-like protein